MRRQIGGRLVFTTCVLWWGAEGGQAQQQPEVAVTSDVEARTGKTSGPAARGHGGAGRDSSRGSPCWLQDSGSASPVRLVLDLLVRWMDQWQRAPPAQRTGPQLCASQPPSPGPLPSARGTATVHKHLKPCFCRCPTSHPSFSPSVSSRCVSGFIFLCIFGRLSGVCLSIARHQPCSIRLSF